MEYSVEKMWKWGKPLPLLALPSGLPKMTPTNAPEGFMGSVLNTKGVGVANAETVNDRAKLLLHRLIARRIRSRPDLIESAKIRIAQKRQAGPSFDYIPEWESLLSQDAETLCRSITSRGEAMVRLRLIPYPGDRNRSPVPSCAGRDASASLGFRGISRAAPWA